MAVSRLRRLLREPVLHFVVLGGLLTAVYAAVAPPGTGRQIVVPAPVIDGLRQDHLRRNGAPPDAREEAALIDRYLDTEVLYREALALGLDRGDVIVRRRLVQKMEFLTEVLEPVADPTDAELQRYLDTHAERYALPARVTVSHVFVSADRHGSGAPAVAARLREQLVTGADAGTLGDPFVRGHDFAAASERELAGIFGSAFAAAAMQLPPGEWSPPLPSSYGLHLVRVHTRTPGAHPPLAAVRDRVSADWFEERRAAATRIAVARLREGYDIRIERDTGVAQAAELQRAAPPVQP